MKNVNLGKRPREEEVQAIVDQQRSTRAKKRAASSGPADVTGLTSLGDSIKEGMIAIAGGGDSGNEIKSMLQEIKTFNQMVFAWMQNQNAQ
jgi:hypothetical protein